MVAALSVDEYQVAIPPFSRDAIAAVAGKGAVFPFMLGSQTNASAAEQ
jgi:hypothetical protein